MSVECRWLRTGWLFILLLTPLAVAHGDGLQRPNIVFVFSDDHSPQAIGAYDGWLKELDPTPNIDRLASQGVLFKNSFCTNSICGPSRAVILTGKHSHLNGFKFNGDKFDASQWIFPRAMQQAGYQTAMVGKWHLGCTPQGFDFWQVLPGQGRYYNPVFRTPAGKVTIEGHVSKIVTDLAVDWLDKRDSDKPFLLMCQHKAPHRNWMPAPEHLNLYDEVTIPEPPTLLDKLEDNASPALKSEMSIRNHMRLNSDLFFGLQPQKRDQGEAATGAAVDLSGIRNLKNMTAEQIAAWHQAFDAENEAFHQANLTGDALVRTKHQRYVKNYLRVIRGVDDSVGRLMAYLDEQGLADNTIVIYSSDQGFYLGEHGWYDKRWMYEESLAMPLIVRWPGVARAGKVVESMVQNLDYAPTFLEIAGAQPPDDLQGRSLKPLLAEAPPADWRRSLYYHYHEYPAVHSVARHNGVRTERHKLIHFYQTDEWELYDLQSDPHELSNQYGKRGTEGVTAELKAELRRLTEEAKDDTDRSPIANPDLQSL